MLLPLQIEIREQAIACPCYNHATFLPISWLTKAYGLITGIQLRAGAQQGRNGRRGKVALLTITKQNLGTAFSTVTEAFAADDRFDILARITLSNQ